MTRNEYQHSIGANTEYVRTITLFAGRNVTAGGYVESDPISLANMEGYVSIQPDIAEGTFDVDVFVSDFEDQGTDHWSSAISVATGLTSSDTDSIPVDLNGVHQWMKFRATETSGTGSPAFGDGIAVCIK